MHRRAHVPLRLGSALGLAGVLLGLTFRMASSAVEPGPSPAQEGGEALERRAVEAAIWAMPIVSFDAMRQAFFRDASAKYGDIVFWSRPSDWRNQTTTPNGSSLYVYFNYNTKDGPVVLDFPAAEGADMFGTVLDAWQTALVDVGPKGEDGGKGGQYLILPPDFQGPPPGHYIVVRPSTYNGYALFRAIPESRSPADVARAVALIQKLRVYPLTRASDPPEQRFIDMAGKLFDGIVRYDPSFYEHLARMVKEEPVQARDLVAMGQLRTLGIEKGKVYVPDDPTMATLDQAVRRAHGRFVRQNVEGLVPWWPGRHWGISGAVASASKTRFTFETPDALDVDGRAALFYLAYAPPARLGEASFYLAAFRDARGDDLTGERRYRMHVPPNVPAAQFWSFSVYDLDTGGFFRGASRVTLDSYDRELRRNPDGSVDIDLGSTPVKGREANWIPTFDGARWFAFFRVYGPGKSVQERTWLLPDIEPAR